MEIFECGSWHIRYMFVAIAFTDAVFVDVILREPTNLAYGLTDSQGLFLHVGY